MNGMSTFRKSPTRENFDKVTEGMTPARLRAKTRFYKSVSRPLREWEKAWVGFADEVDLPRPAPVRTRVLASRGGSCPTWC